MNSLFTTLNSGELSPLLTCRHTLEKRDGGCKRLENLVVLEHGGVSRRPGVRRCDELAYYQNHRLIPFEASMTHCFVVDLCQNDIRVYNMEGKCVWQKATSLTDAALEKFQFCQVNDVLWLAHPDFPLYQLSWYGGSSFTFEPFAMKVPPWQEPFDQDSGVWVENHGNAHAKVTGENGVPVFRNVRVGQKFKIKLKTTAQSFKFGGIGQSIDGFYFAVKGKWKIKTAGSWVGRFELWRSEENELEDGDAFAGSFTQFKVLDSSNGDAKENFSLDGDEEELVYYNIRRVGFSNGDFSGTLTVDPFEHEYVGTVADILAESQAVIRLQNPFHANVATTQWTRKTPTWSLEALSHSNGYASTITFYQGRLWLGGNRSRPQTVWASRTDNYADFSLGDKADDGLELTILSQTRDRIAWIAAGDGILLGTESSEWSIAGEQGKALGPGCFDIKRQSGDGSAAIQPLMAPQSLIFAKQGGTKLLELAYSFQAEGWQTQDLSLLSEHVTRPGIRQFALQRLPTTIVWCVLHDNTLAGLTYNRSQQVMSWHRHVIGENWKVLSCSVTHDPRDNAASGYDALWLVVEKGGKKHLMKMVFDPARGVWKDDGVTYVSRLTLMPVDLLAQDGHTVGKPKRIASAALRVTEGSACRAGTDANGSLTPVDFGRIGQDQGWLQHVLTSGTQREACFDLIHDKAEPFTLLAIDLQWEPNM